MGIKEDIDNADSESRLVCGALFGLVAGGIAAFVSNMHSIGLSITLIVVLTLACSFLAWKYGDDFWRAIFHSDGD